MQIYHRLSRLSSSEMNGRRKIFKASNSNWLHIIKKQKLNVAYIVSVPYSKKYWSKPMQIIFIMCFCAVFCIVHFFRIRVLVNIVDSVASDLLLMRLRKDKRTPPPPKKMFASIQSPPNMSQIDGIINTLYPYIHTNSLIIRLYFYQFQSYLKIKFMTFKWK